MPGLVGLGEAVLLVAEVLVEGVAGDGGRFDQVGDRGGFVAALGGDLRHRGKQPLALVAQDFVRGEGVPPARQAAGAVEARFRRGSAITERIGPLYVQTSS